MTTSNLSITGMGCSGCAGSVEQALKSVDGVQDVKVNLQEASAMVTFDETKADKESLSEAVSNAGYGVKEG